MIDDGMSLPEALVAPRVFMGFEGGVEMETSGPHPWTEAEIESVRRLGFEVRALGSLPAFALVQALWRNPETGTWTAVSEPDGEGAAAAVGGR